MDFLANVDWFNIIASVGYIVLGGVVAYYKSSATLQSKAAEVIKTAEYEFKGIQVGGQRFNWAVDYLYSIIPKPLKIFISRPMIENIVQTTFDNMAEFAKEQITNIIEGEK